MSKKILGDNPFSSHDRPDSGAEPAPADADAAAPADADAAAPANADAAAPADADAAAPADADAAAPADADAAPADADAAAPADADAAPADTDAAPADADAGPASNGTPVDAPLHRELPGESETPDAAELPPDWLADDDDRFRDTDDVFLGGEAVVPEREYGPPIVSVLPDPRVITREIRELERRVRARLTPAFPIEHRRRLPLEFLWKRYRGLAMRGRSTIVDEFGRDPQYAARYEPLLDFLYRTYFRVEAHGVDHVPDTGRAILVANHAGTLPLDGLLLMHALRREHPARRDSRPLVEDMVYHFPYLGTFVSRMGGVRACPENAERLLTDGQVVIVFPEGVKGMGKLYRDRYQLQRFGRGGFIKLALRTRSPIIPVAVVGAEEANPMLGKVTWLARSLGTPYIPITPTFPLLGPLGLMPLPSKWFLRFGPPLDVAATHGPEAAGDRIVVNRLAESVRSTIQGMVDETLAARRSVIFG